jgi:hypothetical protein
MPLNLTKKYPDLLDLMMSEAENLESLRGVFRRDIEGNTNFLFRGVCIYPLKREGQFDMEVLFDHLTRRGEDTVDGTCNYKHRVFEKERSERLHWIRHHIEEKSPNCIHVFTLEERTGKGKNVIKTYIYDSGQKYVIILEHQRKGGYYLLTAYYLSEKYGSKKIEKKLKQSQKRTQGPNHI